MKAAPQESEFIQPDAGRFATTHWTVVLTAGHADSAEGREALETLCRTYWYPLYAFIRKQGFHPPDAEDLTQAYFVHLLGKHVLANVAREKGKFRSFLLASLKNFLANERDRLGAQKRGGGQIHVPIDTAAAETRYGIETADPRTAEKAFERHWAITLLDTVLDRFPQSPGPAHGMVEPPWPIIRLFRFLSDPGGRFILPKMVLTSIVARPVKSQLRVCTAAPDFSRHRGGICGSGDGLGWRVAGIGRQGYRGVGLGRLVLAEFYRQHLCVVLLRVGTGVDRHP
jgi:DNA-directed RNA polymerase specialized sigma24 family protein